MPESRTDALLMFGKMLARLLQMASALAGGIVLLLIPVVVLASQGMVPALSGSNAIAASPLAVVAILAMLGLILAALFSFFGKLRAIIVSAGDGDPFTPGNARRLTVMAWLFLAVKILVVLVAAVRLHVANLIDAWRSGKESLDFSLYDLDALVIVVVLFVLARIFRHGAAMRDDLDGTV